MSEGVTIELDHGGTSKVSQHTLESAAAVEGAGGNAVLPEGAQPVHYFKEDYHWTSLESEAEPTSETSRLFRRVGERQYLWNILESENPWGLSNNKQRNATWIRAAEEVVKPGHVDVTDEQGKRTVEVDVCKGTHIPIDTVTKKIKRLWLSSKTAFLRGSGRTFAKTGESIAPAAEWRPEENSEMFHLSKAVRRFEVACATRHLKPIFSTEHALAFASARDQAAELMPSTGGRSAGPGESGSDRICTSDERGGGGGEHGGENSSPGPANHARGEGLRPFGEDAEVLEDEEKEESPPVDGAPVVELSDERAQALARGTLGRQVTQGAGGRKRKSPNTFEEGMDASSILGLVGERLIDRMDNGGGGIAAVQRQVNQRLDLMAAEQKRALDGIVAQQNVMSGQLTALLTVISQTAVASAAAPPPSAYGAHHHHAAHMAGLPWLGVHPGFLPPGAAMGFGGLMGPQGVGGVATGLQASGAHLPGFGNAGAAIGVAGVANMAGQLKQGGPAVGDGGAGGQQAGEAPAPAAGTAEAWRVSQVLRGSCNMARPMEGAEEKGEGEDGSVATATTKSAC